MTLTTIDDISKLLADDNDPMGDSFDKEEKDVEEEVGVEEKEDLDDDTEPKEEKDESGLGEDDDEEDIE